MGEQNRVDSFQGKAPDIEVIRRSWPDINNEGVLASHHDRAGFRAAQVGWRRRCTSQQDLQLI